SQNRPLQCNECNAMKRLQKAPLQCNECNAMKRLQRVPATPTLPRRALGRNTGCPLTGLVTPRGIQGLRRGKGTWPRGGGDNRLCLKMGVLRPLEVDKWKGSKTTAACQLSRKTRVEAYPHEDTIGPDLDRQRRRRPVRPPRRGHRPRQGGGLQPAGGL